MSIFDRIGVKALIVNRRTRVTHKRFFPSERCNTDDMTTKDFVKKSPDGYKLCRYCFGSKSS